jgi:hypothetical protein
LRSLLLIPRVRAQNLVLPFEDPVQLMDVRHALLLLLLILLHAAHCRYRPCQTAAAAPQHGRGLPLPSSSSCPLSFLATHIDPLTSYRFTMVTSRFWTKFTRRRCFHPRACNLLSMRIHFRLWGERSSLAYACCQMIADIFPRRHPEHSTQV